MRQHQTRCVLRCTFYGGRHCARCPVPDGRGAPKCPRCRRRLSFLDVHDERAQWGCSNLTGCGVTVSFPVGDVSVRDTPHDQERRKKQRLRMREYRRRRAETASGVGGV
jgi:hypothetical protein